VESPAVQLVRSLHAPGADLVTLFGDDEVFEGFRSGLAQVVAPDARMRADLAGMESLEETGPTGFRRLWLEWIGPYSAYTTRLRDIVDCGTAVLTSVTDTAQMRGSEQVVELHTGALWEVRDGRVAGATFFTDPRRLFTAAGPLLIRHAFDCLSRRDRDGFIASCNADCRLVGLRAALEGGGYEPPGAAARFFDDAHAAWEGLSVELGEVEPDGPDRWIATGRISARGLDSDTPVHTPARWRMELREGRLAEAVTEL
jgi:ketosteroid isomerase-like protein